MTDTTPLTGEELAAIKARVEAATPGPWRVDKTLGWDTLVGPEGHDYVAEFGVRDDPDADFAAHAREDVPRLVAEVKRLRAQVDEIPEALIQAYDRGVDTGMRYGASTF